MRVQITSTRAEVNVCTACTGQRSVRVGAVVNWASGCHGWTKNDRTFTLVPSNYTLIVDSHMVAPIKAPYFLGVRGQADAMKCQMNENDNERPSKSNIVMPSSAAQLVAGTQPAAHCIRHQATCTHAWCSNQSCHTQNRRQCAQFNNSRFKSTLTVAAGSDSRKWALRVFSPGPSVVHAARWKQWPYKL